jgi:hypothetical protein
MHDKQVSAVVIIFHRCGIFQNDTFTTTSFPTSEIQAHSHDSGTRKAPYTVDYDYVSSHSFIATPDFTIN